MRLIYIALVVLAVFVAVWMMIVAPAERRHHERKLDALQKRIEARETRDGANTGPGSPDAD